MTRAPLVDSQVHVWTAGTVLPPLPGWPTEFTCNDVLNLIDGAGVDMALLNPPYWQEFDSSVALECARRHPDRFAVYGHIDPSAPGAPETFKELISEPGFVGFRIIFINDRESEWLSNGKLRGGALEWLFEAAEEAGVPLAFGASSTPEPADVGLVAADHPKLRLLVSADRGSGLQRDPELYELARHENVYVKFVGLPDKVTDPSKPSPFSYMDPFLKSIVDAFGARRCLWASDVTKYLGKRTLSELLNQFRVGCPFLSDEDREWILGRTAAEVYGLDLEVAPKRPGARVPELR